MKPLSITSLVSVLATVLFVGHSTMAADVVYPEDSGVINVKKAPYNAKGDGKTDDTKAIQQALDVNANQDKIIYLPAGTYLVSDTLKWGSGKHGGMAQKRTILQGQHRDKTIIKLKDNCPGFNKKTAPQPKKDKKGKKKKPRSPSIKAVIWTGQAPAQRFRNGIRDLTVNIGKSNPGASGIQYIANNQGSMRRVKITSDDDQGIVGLDMGYSNEVGPCLIYDIEVIGFDYGIYCSNVVDSMTLENITLKNQKICGIYNKGQCISVRNFKFTGDAPAVQNIDANSVAALENITAKGSSAKAGKIAAIQNQAGYMYVRNLKVSGFAKSLDNTGKNKKLNSEPTGNEVKEFSSHQPDSVFTSPAKHLGLPRKEFPEVPLYPLEEWVSPLQFGGNPNDKKDDTAAIQKAIDSGKKVVYLPYATKKEAGWIVDGTVEVRGNVEVIDFLENRVNGSGTFKVLDGAPKTVWLNRFDWIYRHIKIEKDTKRTLVISGATFGKGHLTIKQVGDIFLADVCMGRLVIPTGTNVWARQLNIEHKGDKHPETPEKIDNSGTLWILGYKTEMPGSVLRTRKGGKSEVFGGFIYAQGKPKKQAMLIVDEGGKLSATLGEVSWNFGKQGFKTLLEETRSGTTKKLPGGAKAGRYWHGNGASAVPLITAYE